MSCDYSQYPDIAALLGPDFDPERECRELLDRMMAEHEAREATQPSPRLSYEEAATLYAEGNKRYTPAEAAELLVKIQAAGFPLARIVGGVAVRGESWKDVDILIPLRYRKHKTACIQALRQVFVPSCISTDCRGTDGFGMVAEPYGVLDFFFNDRHK